MHVNRSAQISERASLNPLMVSALGRSVYHAACRARSPASARRWTSRISLRIWCCAVLGERGKRARRASERSKPLGRKHTTATHSSSPSILTSIPRLALTHPCCRGSRPNSRNWWHGLRSKRLTEHIAPSHLFRVELAPLLRREDAARSAPGRVMGSVPGFEGGLSGA